MGNDQTTLKEKQLNIPNLTKYIALSAKHNQKIFQKKVKSFEEFSFIIKSILIRSSYLKYEWTQWLCLQLKKDSHKLYQNYCELFKLNLLTNVKDKNFYQIDKFQQLFIQSFVKKQQNQINKEITQDKLNKIFQEAKCYIMVESWFAQIPVNLKKIKQNKLAQSRKNNQNINPDLVQDNKSKLNKCLDIKQKSSKQKMYQFLLKITQIYFQSNLKDKQLEITSLSYSPQKYKKVFNNNQMQMIKILAKQNNFKLRQLIINKLINSMMNCNIQPNQKIQQIFKAKIKLLTKILGFKNVYCMLRILKEVGSSQNQKIYLVFTILENIIKLQNKLK